MDFGKSLERLIEQSGHSKKDVAAALGIAPNTLSGYINNHRQPDLDMLIKIADYFHTSTDHLLDYKAMQNNSHLRVLSLVSHRLEGLDENQLELVMKLAEQVVNFDIKNKK